MSNNIRANVFDLWQSPIYRSIIEKVEELRPLQIRYDPKTDNIEQLKFNSAQLQLHDLLLSILKPNQQEINHD